MVAIFGNAAGAHSLGHLRVVGNHEVYRPTASTQEALLPQLIEE
jgi:hypothetical protein